ncbi:biopolymer transporter ExbD [Alteraurantiacibacter buctensis]|uniref:Biopolymer transporter ExbD n=1 Tax=Alteraurantiacibacter buctensis TaxID=1503981 RepID=A0A844YX30_9SPHN|nr:biopolymer transporter ExbD [Alteraurantiacibacter buctensis]MXO70627.1 hypothetical protein [Alteraurantiacibacter buctensis]
MGPLAGVLLLAMALVAATDKTPTHTLMVNLPPPSILDHQERLALARTPVIRLSVTAYGVVRSNGIRVLPEELEDRLDETLSQPFEPFIVFDPDPDAPYAMTLLTLATVVEKVGSNRRFCFGELERFRTYEDLTPRPRAVNHPGGLPSGCADPSWVE